MTKGCHRVPLPTRLGCVSSRGDQRRTHVRIGIPMPAALAVFVVVSGSACGTDPKAADDALAPTTAPTSPAATSATPTVARLDLDDVPPVSAPLVLSEYLNAVQFTVGRQVGDGVFGAVAMNADTEHMSLTIYGTDADQLMDAVDRIAVDARERITVSETQFS